LQKGAKMGVALTLKWRSGFAYRLVTVERVLGAIRFLTVITVVAEKPTQHIVKKAPTVKKGTTPPTTNPITQAKDKQTHQTKPHPNEISTNPSTIDSAAVVSVPERLFGLINRASVGVCIFV
jgi:hypothetical protein